MAIGRSRREHTLALIGCGLQDVEEGLLLFLIQRITVVDACSKGES